MSDPTPGGAGLPEPGRPEPTPPDATPSDAAPPDVPQDETPPAPGDETVRVPVEPEVAWTAPEPPRAMPWEAPAAAAPAVVPLPGVGAAQPVDAAGPAEGDGSPPPPPAGVLSAATVGWVAPPVPITTGQPGWVIASVGVRFAAYIIDGLLVGLLFGLVIGVLTAFMSGSGTALALAYTVVGLGIYFLYFVGFWTGDGKATLGMRLFKLQVANAADGKRLELGPAVIRWLALGYFLDVLLFVPVAGLVSLIWSIVLLITTNNDPMHQGLHDRWAKSVVVRPEGAGAGGGLVVACLVIVLIIAVFAILSIVALVFVGSQVSTILSTVGESI